MGKLKQPPERWEEVLDELMRDLPGRIAAERQRANLSVPDAARTANIEPSNWHKIEKGTVKSPGIRLLLEVQHALGLESLEPLFGLPSGRRLNQ